jgi:hypothetical protein
MPQFDIVSFLPQLLWLVVTFLGFYFIFTRYYLPNWGSTLKARKKIILNIKENSEKETPKSFGLLQVPKIKINIVSSGVPTIFINQNK